MVRQDGGGWKIEVADDWQRPMWGGSSSRGTGEPCLGDTSELSLRAYGVFAAEHRASAASASHPLSGCRYVTLYYVWVLLCHLVLCLGVVMSHCTMSGCRYVVLYYVWVSLCHVLCLGVIMLRCTMSGCHYVVLYYASFIRAAEVEVVYV